MFAIFNLYIKGVWCQSSAEEIKLLKAEMLITNITI